MAKQTFFTRQRIITIIITLILCTIALVLRILGDHDILQPYPIFPVVMLVLAATYTFFGCLLQNFKKRKASLALGVVVFFGLCTALFYSTTIVDFITFFLCMSIVIRRSSRLCSCMCEMEGNPLE